LRIGLPGVSTLDRPLAILRDLTREMVGQVQNHPSSICMGDSLSPPFLVSEITLLFPPYFVEENSRFGLGPTRFERL